MKQSKLALLILVLAVVLSSGVSRADNSYVFIYAFSQASSEGSDIKLTDKDSDLTSKPLPLNNRLAKTNDFFAMTTLFNDKLQQLMSSISSTSTTKIIRGKDTITKQTNCSAK